MIDDDKRCVLNTDSIDFFNYKGRKLKSLMRSKEFLFEGNLIFCRFLILLSKNVFYSCVAIEVNKDKI